MYIQFDDGLFRRNFQIGYERVVLYDKEGDLIAISTNKSLLKSDLKQLFAGEFIMSDPIKLGNMHKATIYPRSPIRSDRPFINKGNEVADPYPEPCDIIKLTVQEKELVNKDCRSKKLTWFLNQCSGRESYAGVAAQQVLASLEADGIVSVSSTNGFVTMERILWPEDE